MHIYALHPPFHTDPFLIPFQSISYCLLDLLSVIISEKNWGNGLQTDKCPNWQKSEIFHPERVLSLHTKAVHLREKPQECEFCQNIFSLKSSLQKHIAAFPLSLHIKAVHLKEKPQECEFCQNIFSCMSLQQHDNPPQREAS